LALLLALPGWVKGEESLDEPALRTIAQAMAARESASYPHSASFRVVDTRGGRVFFGHTYEGVVWESADAIVRRTRYHQSLHGQARDLFSLDGTRLRDAITIVGRRALKMSRWADDSGPWRGRYAQKTLGTLDEGAERPATLGLKFLLQPCSSLVGRAGARILGRCEANGFRCLRVLADATPGDSPGVPVLLSLSESHGYFPVRLSVLRLCREGAPMPAGSEPVVIEGRTYVERDVRLVDRIERIGDVCFPIAGRRPIEGADDADCAVITLDRASIRIGSTASSPSAILGDVQAAVIEDPEARSVHTFANSPGANPDSLFEALLPALQPARQAGGPASVERPSPVRFWVVVAATASVTGLLLGALLRRRRQD